MTLSAFCSKDVGEEMSGIGDDGGGRSACSENPIAGCMSLGCLR